MTMVEAEIGVDRRLVMTLEFDYERGPSSTPATLGDCHQLMAQITRILALAEASPSIWISPLGGSDDPGALRRQLTAVLDHHLAPGADLEVRSPVLRLQYASPWYIEVALHVGEIGGLGVLFFAAKRLYGADFEFKAHREEQRANYLRAKALADALERVAPRPGQDPDLPLVSELDAVSPAARGDRERWQLRSAEIRDDLAD